MTGAGGAGDIRRAAEQTPGVAGPYITLTFTKDLQRTCYLLYKRRASNCRKNDNDSEDASKRESAGPGLPPYNAAEHWQPRARCFQHSPQSGARVKEAVAPEHAEEPRAPDRRSSPSQSQ